MDICSSFIRHSMQVETGQLGQLVDILAAIMESESPLSCAGAILKNRHVCYGTSRLKNRVCAVTRDALLITPTLKSNKR